MFEVGALTLNFSQAPLLISSNQTGDFYKMYILGITILVGNFWEIINLSKKEIL